MSPGRSLRWGENRGVPEFSPYRSLPEMHPLFCDPCDLLRLFLFVRFVLLDQRLINQISKTLEEAVLVVWEVLGKDEHDKFFGRIDHA
jgi:hypothetical protein